MEKIREKIMIEKREKFGKKFEFTAKKNHPLKTPPYFTSIHTKLSENSTSPLNITTFIKLSITDR